MRKKIIIFLLVALVVILAASVFFRGSNNDVRDATRTTADTFMENLADANADATYSLFTDSLQNEVSESEWKESLDSTFARYDTVVQFDSRSNADAGFPAGSQKLTYVLDFGTGLGEVSLTMTGNGDNWKIAERPEVKSREQ